LLYFILFIIDIVLVLKTVAAEVPVNLQIF